ncbi:MAG: phage repressor protein [Limosilactobacillus fermentum]|nr:MAG: phage repressor protein [Limosilactobacillus fermentum]
MNANKLKGKIVENGLTVSELALKIGVDSSTMYRKISAKNGDKMLIREVKEIIEILHLTDEEAVSIFFN